jgi:VanZ family protein
MSALFISETSVRLRKLLAVGYTLFIVYVSLSPFSNWREQGYNFIDVLQAPLTETFTLFDGVVNLAAYIPYGFLLGLAFRSRFSAIVSILLATFCGFILSMCIEYLQMYLPARVSSNMDILSNSTGTLLGVLLAVSATSWRWFRLGLLRWRNSLFTQGKEIDFGLALLLLWIFGQINPTLPMLGHVFISAEARQPFMAPVSQTFSWWECTAVMLNLLMLGILLLTVLRQPRHIASALLVILSIVASVKFIAAAVLLKSWAILLWINGEAMLGILTGLLLLIAIYWQPRAILYGLGVIVSLSDFIAVNFRIDGNTPEVAKSIYHWHYGNLLNYNGLAQTITLIFPLLLIFHLWQIRNR